MREKREKAIKFFQDMQECTYGNLEEVDMAIHALEQEQNVIEEFKKIKDEIENTGAYEQEVHGKTEFLKGITYCLSIIDKHIKELKGE